MAVHCPFLNEYKVFHLINANSVIYRCELGKVLLKQKDLNKKWACGGCIVPWILAGRPCRYLKPRKDFILRGSSQTWFTCELLDISLERPHEFCDAHCQHYIPV
ncbi:hypothetical protein LZ11_00012 [Thermosediminibacter litoriperuensis]|uniref:Uncharacterized protein n=1 Tax=Thermosediminibacter litoriperuensis TaxID=291989 RepID=A0A5S5B0D2_9FIRM|nr:hypothetical protein LZ11_00012 [Thermosediminibacter litoriperuensis]